MGINNRKNRNAKKRREIKRRSIKPPYSKDKDLGDFEFDDRISVTGISVQWNDKSIQLQSDEEYAIQDDPQQPPELLTISLALLEKLKAVSNRYTFEFIPKANNPKHQQLIANTWPQSWNYLSNSEVENLKQSGVINSQLLLMESISRIQFGKFIYSKTDVNRFLDTLTEIAWIDYVIREQLDHYQRIYDPRYVTVGENFEFNPRVAKCWMTLENCVIRIAGMWDRLRSFLLPLYFFGKSFEEMQPSLNSSNPWGDLNNQILQVVSGNTKQQDFYRLLANASRDFERGQFKNLRNRVVHEFTSRPAGVVPTGESDIPSLDTIEDLYQLVGIELDKVREAMVIFIAMIVCKSPKNVLRESDK